MSHLSRADEDARDIYIGNLNTVEFDLVLPKEGKRGSIITWKSNNTRFVSDEGEVTQPRFGMGPRDVVLTATCVAKDGSFSERTFTAHVIEAKNDIKIQSVENSSISCKTGTSCILPGVVIVTDVSGCKIAHAVEWQAPETVIFDEPGHYSVKGTVLGTSYPVEVEIKVEDTYSVSKLKHTNKFFVATPQTVKLLDSEFYRQQNRTLEFLLSVNDDQMLYNFREVAQLDTKGAPQMIGWDAPECLLKGHTTGHYLSALAAAFNATSDERLRDKARYMVDELKKCQESMEAKHIASAGFLSAYREDQFDRLEQFTPYPTIWAPYYTLHKILSGLIDCWKIFEFDNAKILAIGIGDWVFERLSRLTHKQRTKMWSIYIAGEFGGMNDALVELYNISNNENHLIAATYFNNDKLYIPMEENVDTLNNVHANQHIPQVIGALKLFEATSEKKYFDIAKNFWDIVTTHHSYVIGGTGESEMWHEPDEIASRLTEHTAESCCSYNMLKLSSNLYQLDGDITKLEYIERTMFNHILASGDKHSHGASTYFMPLAPGFKKEFDDENSCCHGTGLENHFKYCEYIFYTNDSEIQIAQLVSATLSDNEKEILSLEVTDAIGGINVKVKALADITLPVKVRIPSWAYAINIEGSAVQTFQDKHWLTCEKGMVKNESLSFTLSCDIRIESAPDDETICSVLWGPYVLAFESDSSEFIDLSKQDLQESFEQISDGPFFKYLPEAINLRPLAFIDDERYQVYVRH